jgi:hypothetical protein
MSIEALSHSACADVKQAPEDFPTPPRRGEGAVETLRCETAWGGSRARRRRWHWSYIQVGTQRRHPRISLRLGSNGRRERIGARGAKDGQHAGIVNPGLSANMNMNDEEEAELNPDA